MNMTYRCENIHTHASAHMPCSLFPLPVKLHVLWLTELRLLAASFTAGMNGFKHKTVFKLKKIDTKRKWPHKVLCLFLQTGQQHTDGKRNVKVKIVSSPVYIQGPSFLLGLFHSACSSRTHRSAKGVEESKLVGQSTT